MLYKPFHEWNISQLGMGNMRLPTVGGARGVVDEARAKEIVQYAYEHGVNYFDTAYRYHDGASEPFIGKALSQYPRESWHLASKMPGHMMNYVNGKLGFQGYLAGESIESPAQIFEEHLERCGVEYFDFYLLHNVCETSFDFYTDENLGLVEYLLAQKRAGRIRHLGFSAHGRAETIEKFLDWKDGFEFVQIQLNYVDWVLQDAKAKYEMLEKRGIPVVVMEPCRGGKLADLPEDAAKILKTARPEDSLASWAFRFVKSLPNVLVTLSGMSDMAQVRENVELFSREDEFSADEERLLQKARDAMFDLVPCTACRYCCEACPKGLEIPKLISMYNDAKHGGEGLLHFTMGAMKPEELPSACIGCGACKKLCPQNIDIPAVMRSFSQMLEK